MNKKEILLTLNDFTKSDYPLISETAKTIQMGIKGGLSDSELEELTKDLMKSMKIQEEIESIENKLILEEAYEVMKLLISTFKP